MCGNSALIFVYFICIIMLLTAIFIDLQFIYVLIFLLFVTTDTCPFILHMIVWFEALFKCIIYLFHFFTVGIIVSASLLSVCPRIYVFVLAVIVVM